MVGEPHYANKSAIVLDDNPQMRGILRSVLNSMGLRSVSEYSDPIAAHNHLEGNHVDVAVVDLVLNSSINGMELALAIRHNPLIVNPMMPVIMVTGYASASVIKQAINFGVDELVTKPFSARDLMARVEKTFKRPRTYIRTPSAILARIAAVAQIRCIMGQNAARRIWPMCLIRKAKPCVKPSRNCAQTLLWRSARLKKSSSCWTRTLSALSTPLCCSLANAHQDRIV
jgi:two-component system chemotaxis response regulator CheY